jgi:hypothetical protein
MKKTYFVSIIIFFIAFSGFATDYVQKSTYSLSKDTLFIRGNVQTITKKKKHKPIPFSSIMVKGENKIESTTDFDGNFVLDVSSLKNKENITLVIKSVGYIPREVQVKLENGINIEIFLEEPKKK